MLIHTISNRIPQIRPLIRIPKRRLPLILHKVILKTLLLLQPFLVKQRKHANSQCEEYQVENELSTMS